jgi:hypothetical protein
MSIVVDFADLNQLEVANEVLPQDEEDSICICLSFDVLVIKGLLVGW